ncbi:MAG: hypothetical protein JWO38_1508 [Gemmataceae bacterium]|nr:hypothetical protein [Gemmataceae bacterium]
MPIVGIPGVFLDPTVATPTWAEIRVEARTARTVVDELLGRWPQLATRHFKADGRPSTDWFGLWREEDEYDLRYEPDTVLGEDDRVHLVNLIGC